MNLQDAINNLYTAFADVPRPEQLDGCPCCTDPIHLKRIVTEPLRLLSADDMSKYGGKATTTIGTGADYLYFLPRLLELSTRHELTWPDAEVLLMRLRGNECPMKDHHWDVLHEFLMSWWVALLVDPDVSSFQLNELLAGVQLMGGTWKTYLNAWDNESSPEATYKLATFISRYFYDLDDHKKFNAFLETDRELPALKAWLARAEIISRLEITFFGDPDHDMAQDISDALLILENYK